MQLTLQIVITDESGSSRTEELMTIQKSGRPGTTSDYRCQNQAVAEYGPAVGGPAAGRRIYSTPYPVPSLPCCAQNQRQTENTVPDAVWRYSGIRASGVPVPL
nr:hypothetical protein [Escherichia coli]